MSELIYTATTWVIPLLLCVIIHEVAHGWVALRLGDRTALYAGRLTLNPAAHVDWAGSIFLPLFLLAVRAPFLFGWAKPVPVDFRNLNNPKRDMGWVAVAGPLSNILLAFAFAVVLKGALLTLSGEWPFSVWLVQNLRNGIMLSLVIAIFNLLPILPLDGGRIVASVLPLRASILYQRTEKYGLFVLAGVLLLLPLVGIDAVSWFINALYPALLHLIIFWI